VLSKALDVHVIKNMETDFYHLF